MRISDWSSDVCSSDLVGSTGLATSDAASLVCKGPRAVMPAPSASNVHFSTLAAQKLTVRNRPGPAANAACGSAPPLPHFVTVGGEALEICTHRSVAPLLVNPDGRPRSEDHTSAPQYLIRI